MVCDAADTDASSQWSVLSEKQERLFSQLKNDLINPTNTMEETFELMCELKCAMQRTPALKKLFWRVGNFANFDPLEGFHFHANSLHWGVVATGLMAF